MKTVQQSYPELAAAFGVPEVYLKREDQHKYGSHKGRSIPLMIKKYAKEGHANFVISSSGNAALAAIYAVRAHNYNNPQAIKLTVYIGKNINPEKLKIILAVIDDANIKLEQVDKPKQKAFQVDKKEGIKMLRQSTDDTALEGYFELADELSKIPNLQAVFIPTSSGTTAQGLGEAFAKLKINPQIHIVQTTACHPIADEIRDKRYEIQDTNQSIADAIVDKIAHRKEKVLEIIKNSHGSGWIADDEEIKDAIKLVEDACNILISPNSALSIVGLKKAVENGFRGEK